MTHKCLSPPNCDNKVHLDCVGGPKTFSSGCAFFHFSRSPTEARERGGDSCQRLGLAVTPPRETQVKMGGGDSIRIISCFDWQRSARRPSRDLFDVRGRRSGRNKEPPCPLIDGYNYLPFEEKKRGKVEGRGKKVPNIK